MKKNTGITLIVLGLAACAASDVAVPSTLTVRSTVGDRVPEGTEILVAMPDYPVPTGTTFTVKANVNSTGAYCVATALDGARLYLHTITPSGIGSDPHNLRNMGFTYSSVEMPLGTQFRITGLSPAFCGGGYRIHTAVVVNGM